MSPERKLASCHYRQLPTRRIYWGASGNRFWTKPDGGMGRDSCWRRTVNQARVLANIAITQRIAALSRIDARPYDEQIAKPHLKQKPPSSER